MLENNSRADHSDTNAERRKVMAARNRVLGLALLGFVVLFFAITLVKLRH